MKQIISASLAAVMAAFALTACTPADASKTVVDFKQPTGTSSVSCVINGSSGDLTNCFPNDPEAIRPGFEDVDFGGYTFVFVSPLETKDGWAAYEVYGEESGMGALNASIEKRNELLAKHYDCNIRSSDIEKGVMLEDFNINRNTADIVLTRYNLYSKANGSYYNFYDLDIDFVDKPWFDGNFIDDMTVSYQLYAMLGAFSLTSFDATQVMFYNKNVQNKTDAIKNIDFYELAYNGEWTLDKFYEISKLAACDKNGDGAMTLGTDTFGFVSTSGNISGLYFGAGQSYVGKVDNPIGETEFVSSFSDAAIEATDKIVSIYADAGTVISEDNNKNTWQFRSDEALFLSDYLKNASLYSVKYGTVDEKSGIDILPFPALNEEQSKAREYYNYVGNQFIYMCIPKICTDLEQIADFVEVYAYHSYYTVYRDYLDLYKNTYATDPRSGDMVKMILESRNFDLAYHFAWASFDMEYKASVNNGVNAIRELGDSFKDAMIEAANKYRDNMKPAEYSR